MQRNTLAALIAGLFTLPVQAEEIPLLDEIVVTATRIPQSRAEVFADVHVLSAQALKNAGQASLSELLQSQPGIEVTSNGGPGQPANLMLGGYSGSHTLVLIDGFRIGSATLGSTPLEQLIPAGFDRVEVMRGSGSHLYGSDAMGGVLQLLTPVGSGEPRLHGSAGLGSFDTKRLDAGLSGAFGSTHFAFDLGRLDSDGYDATNANVPFGAHNPDKDGFRNDHALLRIGTSLADRHQLNLIAYRTQGVARYDDSAGANDTHSDSTEGLLGLTLQSHLNAGWESRLRVGASTDDARYFTSFGTTEYHSEQRQYTWQNDFEFDTSHVQASLERLEQTVSGSVAYTTRERDNTALVLAAHTRFIQHNLELAWRHDHNSQFGDKDTGALGYAWRIAPDWKAGARIATAFKAPAFNDLYYPNDGFAQGNPNLKPEQSVSRELRLDGRVGKGAIQLSCHDDRVTDLILWQFDSGLGIFTPSNVNNARLTGCGMSYARPVAGWNGRAGFDWQHVRDDMTGNDLPWRAPRRFTLSLDRKMANWEIGADLSAVARRYNDAANTQRLPAYLLANLTAAYSVNADWRIEGRLANVSDQRYELIHGYNTPERNLFIGLRYQPH
jgi:vitamin B12 transporter